MDASFVRERGVADVWRVLIGSAPETHVKHV
jgi:hypothetical protein